MCGIVGYVGPRDAVGVIMAGLKRLEYRGYDSAGIAVVQGGELRRRRAAGKLANLAENLAREPLSGSSGVGHTRWATHGRPTEENAHPHQDCEGRLVVIHNGIIENHLALKAELAGQGHRFVTQTDTEVVAHLVESLYQGSLERAVRAAVARLVGVYSLVFLHRDEPDLLVAVRMGPPLVVGLGQGECFVASDIPALLPYTRDFLFLDDGEQASVSRDGARIQDRSGATVTRAPQRITWDPVQAEKGGYRHFMLKEIHEQPEAVRDTLLGRFDLEGGEVHLAELGEASAALSRAERVVFLACGTSWHAALIGEFLFEQLAGIPAEVDYGSEFRYRTPLVNERTLAIAISQSGETADTLAAVREAKAGGATALAVCNVQGSMLTREAAGTLLTHAGPEIGVASTKAFTSQLVVLALLAVHLGRMRGLSLRAGIQYLDAIEELPAQAAEILAREAELADAARLLASAQHVLYCGRLYEWPAALEGALKLKEISYVHAEGVQAAELKHGPIALVDPDVPTVVLAAQEAVRGKTLGNIHEIRARGGRVIALVREGDDETAALAERFFAVPATLDPLLPVLEAIPLQLLAYHAAVTLGRDVDHPRNLAKSVTVE
jgi:glucosamine--fructose-6-phosphate aminotransferase (isomerizing)